MKLATRLFGQTYAFKSIKEVLAKANEPRSGDVLAGVAAQSSQERIAAKHVLSELTLADLRNSPIMPDEEDCVTRLIQDGGVAPVVPSLSSHIPRVVLRCVRGQPCFFSAQGFPRGDDGNSALGAGVVCRPMILLGRSRLLWKKGMDYGIDIVDT